MEYLRVRWIHSFPDDPVMLYSELDDERWELRKVDVYADGREDYADSKEQTGSTGLGKVPTPPLDEIAAQREFEPELITAEEFETAWQSAKTKHGRTL
nr:hypothetical protein [uncultured Hyphomonas sp.]